MVEYIQRGEAIDFTNDGNADIAFLDVIPLETRIGIAGDNIKLGEKKTVHVTGVYRLPKGAEALTVGTEVYWSVDDEAITATQGSNIPAGWVIEPAETGDTEVNVKIG